MSDDETTARKYPALQMSRMIATKSATLVNARQSIARKTQPSSAEFWDSPGTLISYVKMAAAAVTNTRPDLGDNM